MKYVSLLAFVLALNATAFADSAAPRSPRLVVNLLDYVAGDYHGAVSNGKVLSQSEYHEQVEFVTAALETSEQLPETRGSEALLSKIRAVKKLVEAKADVAQVAQAAQAAKAEVIQVTRMAVAPASWPNLTHGKQLFTRNCAACHGESGHGDGPAGAALKPKPADFHAEEIAELSPFKAFNTIRVGVPGTPMAAWPQLTDSDTWDLAFYVISLRYAEAKSGAAPAPQSVTLEKVASLSDSQLKAELKGSDADKALAIAALRLSSGGGGNDGSGGGNTLGTARKLLTDAKKSVESGDTDSARLAALKAYLEGVEPVEPKLRANDPQFVSGLEEKMAAVRSAIEAKKTSSEMAPIFDQAFQALSQADSLLQTHETSPWLAFMIAVGIILREGFEAALVIIALLAVIRASGSRKAAAWVHGGWIFAIVLGVVGWVFSGWLMNISGAGREMMEGVTAALAVTILLYMGFWLHSKTEMHRWKAFIDGQVKAALAGSNLIGLAFISFMAVFREALETILFLRAVWLEAGDSSKAALGFGVVSAILACIVASWALLRYSARIPIRKVFSISSGLMILLSVILAGKGTHSFQETGLVSATASGLPLRWELIGIYPTRETVLAQIAVLVFSGALWYWGNRPPVRKTAVSAARS